jgi:hypothetical protein
MNDVLEKAIKELAAKSVKADKACDAMQLSQAALNLAQALDVWPDK